MLVNCIFEDLEIVIRSWVGLRCVLSLPVQPNCYLCLEPWRSMFSGIPDALFWLADLMLVPMLKHYIDCFDTIQELVKHNIVPIIFKHCFVCMEMLVNILTAEGNNISHKAPHF